MLLSKTTKRIIGDCFAKKRHARYHGSKNIDPVDKQQQHHLAAAATAASEVLSSTSVSDSSSSPFTSSDDRYFANIVKKVQMEQKDEEGQEEEDNHSHENDDDSYCSCSSKPPPPRYCDCDDEQDEEKTFGSYDVHEILLNSSHRKEEIKVVGQQQQQQQQQVPDHDDDDGNYCNHHHNHHDDETEDFHDTTKALLLAVEQESLEEERHIIPFVEMIQVNMIHDDNDVIQPLATTKDSDPKTTADQDERQDCTAAVTEAAAISRQQPYPQMSTSVFHHHQSKSSIVPTWIEFELTNGTEEEENNDHNNNHSRTLEYMIWDATTPLRYRNLDLATTTVMDDAEFFATIADQFHALLAQHLQTPQSVRIQNKLLYLMKTHPCICQIRFPSTDGDFYFPLTYFCITSAHTLVQACYRAFPEAIGIMTTTAAASANNNNNLGILGDAIQHEASPEIIEFLIRKFPEAVKRTNENQQTPLHWACELQSDFRIVQLLLDVYPAAAQLTDCNGDTPLHIFLQNFFTLDNDDVDDQEKKLLLQRNAENILLLLLSTSPLTISTVTANLEKPMHVAVQNEACDLSVIKILHQADHTAIAFTDGMFRLPIHWSVVALARKQQQKNIGSSEDLYSIIEFLIGEFPESVDSTDENGETPLEIAHRLWSCHPPAFLVQLLTKSCKSHKP